MNVLLTLAVVCTGLGMVVVAAGALAVRAFCRGQPLAAAEEPAITVLRPLCGAEPMLEQALASLCTQDYPPFQIVFGVQDANDPALLVVRTIQHRFPHQDIAVVVDAMLHGSNRKISNLMNMIGLAKYDLLVVSDSDLHVAPDYLRHMVDALAKPGVGLVTTVCAGLPTSRHLAARLGASGISHTFLPGALLSRALGRDDCLGTTMALHRHVLEQIGGLAALVDHLADDNLLGRKMHTLGLHTALASTIPAAAVTERSMAALWQHELRWARTIRALEPVLFAASILQFPLFWAALTVLLSGAAPWACALFASVWCVRAIAARITDHAVQPRAQRAIASSDWLLPLRDMLSAVQVFASFTGDRVVWRGHVMGADNGKLLAPPSRARSLAGY